MAHLLRSVNPLITKAAYAPVVCHRVSKTVSSESRCRALHNRAPQAYRQIFGKRAGQGALMASALFSTSSTATRGETPYEFTVKDIDGKDIDLSKYKGKAILVVNVASQCGFTPQYKELGELYDRYSSQGFVILGFPCNQFGGQEPADNSKIKAFATNRGAKFPMMAKVDVNGSKAEPFFSFLKSKQGGLIVSDIKWNFTKFLINKQGEVVKRYGSATTPKSIENDIKNVL